MVRGNKRKRRIIRLAVPGLILLALLVAVFLFRVGKVDVYGNIRHTSDEIASGLSDSFLTQNTLYLMWKYRDGEIPDTLPFLNSMSVQMKSPSHIEVEVSEKIPVAYIEKDGFVFFDGEGIVLEISDQTYDGIPLVTGVNVEEVSLYQKMPVESSAQLRTILSLVKLLADNELSATEIRFSENMEVTVFIQGVEAQLGQDEYLEEKVANLNKILPRLEGQSGTLHLESFTGRNETVSFSPADDTGTVTDVSNGVAAGDDAEGDETGTAADSAQSDADGSAAVPDDQDTADGEAQEDDEGGDQAVIIAMVFDSSGTLVYNVHVENGVVVDSYGTQVPGVTVNEDGNVVDAYMNVFDRNTGELIQ